MYVLQWRTVSVLTTALFWCLFPELRSNEENKHHNNTRVSAEIVRDESTYIILFLTRHNDDKMMMKTTIFTHGPRASLAGFTFCWGREYRLMILNGCSAYGTQTTTGNHPKCATSSRVQYITTEIMEILTGIPISRTIPPIPNSICHSHVVSIVYQNC